jgi:tetratricopeptide (TPR) repeat protein
VDATLDPAGHASEFSDREIDTRFLQAVAMLHAKEYEHAITALHRVLRLAPRLPEAHVNMGFALIGTQRYGAARDFFQSAIDLRPYQANAYWGLAVALEQLDDLEGALGAMRAYIHLSKPDDPYVRKARSALWEWENTLKRGPMPVEEREFLDRGARQWVERNSADVDRPSTAPRVIDLLPPN